VARRKDPVKAARELFNRYDGSVFYMSRDGSDREYRAYGIPKEVEDQWLAELTERKLQRLDQPKNWWSLNFLNDHQDPRHLERVIASPPLGELWERTVYLELMLRYISVCQPAGVSRELIRTALDTAEEHAQKLVAAARSDKSRDRIARVLTEVERRKRKLSLYLVKHPEARG